MSYTIALSKAWFTAKSKTGRSPDGLHKTEP